MAINQQLRANYVPEIGGASTKMREFLLSKEVHYTEGEGKYTNQYVQEEYAK